MAENAPFCTVNFNKKFHRPAAYPHFSDESYAPGILLLIQGSTYKTKTYVLQVNISTITISRRISLDHCNALTAMCISVWIQSC